MTGLWSNGGEVGFADHYAMALDAHRMQVRATLTCRGTAAYPASRPLAAAAASERSDERSAPDEVAQRGNFPSGASGQVRSARGTCSRPPAA